MKLELKHLAPYLPYDLKCEYIEEKDNWYLLGLINSGIAEIESDDYGSNRSVLVDFIKPILRPLSDLTKEIEHDSRIPIDCWDNDTLGYDISKELSLMALNNYCDFRLPYFVMRQLFEWHFDVFDLIEKGLAIDINTLKEKA